MKYPQFLKDNATIGLIATSCGSNKNPYRIRTQVGIKKFIEKGYKIKKGHRLFLNKNAVSGPHTLRASDFNKMYKNKNIDFIWSTGGVDRNRFSERYRTAEDGRDEEEKDRNSPRT